ncbi:MAG: hypothetical protein IKD33_05085 [Bacteroidales bacterium]|nr:hypothetical protein [Bacteroidales bacterium]
MVALALGLWSAFAESRYPFRRKQIFLSAKAGIAFGESKYPFRRKGTINLTPGQGAT